MLFFCENNKPINKSKGNSNKRREAARVILNVESLHGDSTGWTKSLKHLRAFSHAKLENKLVKNNRAMPDKNTLHAYYNLKKGHGLWQEGEKHFGQGKHYRKNLGIFGESKS